MKPTEWKTFVHPHKAYRLEFPAHWENRVLEEGNSCGFGPYERDNVGLWISVMPASLDTDRLGDGLRQIFEQSLAKTGGANIRADRTLKHHGYKADMPEAGQGGHYWILAGGDLVLFASSQVPPDERETWNPQFERLMSSLRITREEELLVRKISVEALAALKEKRPEQNYELEDYDHIVGRDHRLSLDNLIREVRESPQSRARLIENFVNAITSPEHLNMGHEAWDEVVDRVLPVLKPASYFRPEGATARMAFTEWLADVRICYAIRSGQTYRFITDWDLGRWELSQDALHQRALDNLSQLSWPERMEGSRERGGRLILVDTHDGFAASRVLHPEFHRVFSQALESPFVAGIPDRDTLVAFMNRRTMKRRIARQVQKDHDKSAYSITPRLFLVTADGVALAD